MIMIFQIEGHLSLAHTTLSIMNHDEHGHEDDIKEPHRKPPKRKGSSLEDALSDSNSKLGE